LKDKDLTKVGSLYVLPVEAEMPAKMKSLHDAKKKVDTEAKSRQALEAKVKMANSALGQWEYERGALYEKYTKLSDVTQKNNLVARVKALESRIKEGALEKEQFEVQLGKMGGESKTIYVNLVLDLSTRAEEATKRYEELAADADVKQALDAVKPRGKLGPSLAFVANARELKKLRGAINSETITLKMEDHIPWVEVTINGG